VEIKVAHFQAQKNYQQYKNIGFDKITVEIKVGRYQAQKDYRQYKNIGFDCPASQVKRRPKCDRIAPSHPLSWPCVSDLLTSDLKGES